jgi:hypothetical protein
MSFRILHLCAAALLISLFASSAQDCRKSPSLPTVPEQSDTVSTSGVVGIETVSKKWKHFVHETASPLTFGAGAFNASFSQVTHTDPKYGVNGMAYAKRFGASVADITTQNFFGDFVVASAFHEDPRYFREGPSHRLIHRIGYAMSRAVVIRKDTGGNTFNLDNLLGSAMSSGFSDLYYPRASRTNRAMLVHFSIDVADNGFVNLAPEFWPDFSRKFLKTHH